MKIGIIGAGMVGGALTKAWSQVGHEILVGVQDVEDPKIKQLMIDAGGNARAVSVNEAAQGGEVVVMAVPFAVAQDVVREAGDLNGKTLFDCTNPLLPDMSGLVIGHDTSAGEQVASWAAGAKIVKIFNTTGFSNMLDPGYPDGPTTMFYCGDDPASKQVADRLARDIGFDPVDAGPLTQARLLEPLALLWISLAYAHGQGPNIAFRLMHR